MRQGGRPLTWSVLLWVVSADLTPSRAHSCAARSSINVQLLDFLKVLRQGQKGVNLQLKPSDQWVGRWLLCDESGLCVLLQHGAGRRRRGIGGGLRVLLHDGAGRRLLAGVVFF